MGHVYRVYDPVNDRELALKELKFEISPGASYLLQEEQVRWQATGSNIYKPTSGQRIIR